MNLPKYIYRTNDNFLDYEFESIGPKGSIKKEGAAIIDSSIGNYNTHPFFEKKAAEAKKFLEQVGLPAKTK